MERAAFVAHEDLKRGLNTLATLASIAPFVGLFGTLWGIFNSFGSIGTERSTAMAMIADGISRACMPTAVGLFVGLLSLWGYRHLRSRLQEFDHEMADVRLSILNQLALHIGRLRFACTTAESAVSLPYLESYSPHTAAEESYEHHAMAASATLLVLSWCVQAVGGFQLDLLTPAGAVVSGFWTVVVAFACACLLVYAVWVDLLHRRSAGVLWIAAALCCLWSVLGLFIRAIRF
jgi:hypothetical protein